MLLESIAGRGAENMTDQRMRFEKVRVLPRNGFVAHHHIVRA